MFCLKLKTTIRLFLWFKKDLGSRSFQNWFCRRTYLIRKSFHWRRASFVRSTWRSNHSKQLPHRPKDGSKRSKIILNRISLNRKSPFKLMFYKVNTPRIVMTAAPATLITGFDSSGMTVIRSMPGLPMASPWAMFRRVISC